MNNYPLPSDERLEGLIKEAYETVSGPEMARIYQLEERLIRRLPARKLSSRVNNIPWWIVLLVTGGMVTAAWWAGEYFTEDTIEQANDLMQADTISRDVVETGEDQDDKNSNIPEEREEVQQRTDDNNPIIYQRENF